MKTKIGRKLEHGQILPIVAIGIFALAGMAVLLLDVGALYVNRRTAQNAADAGALAGARILCSDVGKDVDAIGVAVDKYVTENHATVSDWDIVEGNPENVVGLAARGEVVVTAAVEHESFFAKIFGEDTLNASATAGAGCFSYRPNVVLPIAWSCRPPAAGSASDDCDIVKIDYADVENVLAMYPGDTETISDALYAIYNDRIYIVMDSNKVCGEDIICDFNPGDGIDRYQLSSGGNRGWLNLTGTSSGLPNLTGWIEDGIDAEIKPHTWLSGTDGNKKPVYDALATRLDEIVWIPIFNVLCPDLPSNNPGCVAAAHSTTPPGVPLSYGQTDEVVTGSPATPVFHVVGFAPFFITCVREKFSDVCLGFTLALDSNPALDTHTRTFEGYFVDPETLGEDVSFGADLGIYTVSLTR